MFCIHWYDYVFLLHTIIVVEYIAYFWHVEQPEISGVEILAYGIIHLKFCWFHVAIILW